MGVSSHPAHRGQLRFFGFVIFWRISHLYSFHDYEQGNSIHDVMTRRIARHFCSAKASRAGRGV